MNMFEAMKKYAVKAESVKDFCDKYHRINAYHERGKDYMDYDLKEHEKEFEEFGYTMIPQGSSATGGIVTFYG